MGYSDYPEFYEHPALHDAAINLTILRAAARGGRSLVDCVGYFHKHLTQGHEPARVGRIELLARLQQAKSSLAECRLIERLDDGLLEITERGRKVLREHPLGIDNSVLMTFPEFRAYFQRTSQARAPEDARPGEFEEGYAAYQEGKLPADNPYETDSAGHLAWENGWFEARDEDAEHHRTTRPRD